MATLTDVGPSSGNPFGDWTLEQVITWFVEMIEKWGEQFGGGGV